MKLFEKTTPLHQKVAASLVDGFLKFRFVIKRLTVLACIFFTVGFCLGQPDLLVHAPLENGCSFTAPYSIEKGEAFLWTVFLTNSLAVPARLDVAARTDVFDERGALLQRLSYVMTTNCLVPGETKLISFPFENFENGWSAPQGVFCYITMEAAILNRTTGEFSVDWYTACSFRFWNRKFQE